MTVYNQNLNSAPMGIQDSGNAVADLFARVFAANQARLARERQEEQDKRQAEEDAQLREERALRLEEAKEARKTAQFERARAAEAMRPGFTEIKTPTISADLTPDPAPDFDPELDLPTQPAGMPDTLPLAPAATLKAPRPQAMFDFGDTEVPLLNRDQLAAEARREKVESGEYMEITPEVEAALAEAPPVLRAILTAGSGGLIKRSTLSGALPALSKAPTAAKDPWGKPFYGDDGKPYQYNESTGEIRVASGMGRKPIEPKGGAGLSEALAKDIERLPSDWRNWNASYVTRDSYPTRNSEQAHAIATANAFGKVLPGKKQGDAAIAAKATLSDIAQAQKLLRDPKVQEYVGVYAGKMTNFLAKGWADPWGGEKNVPREVRTFRAALNRLAAEERHRIYGAALTAIESNYAEGFVPAMDQSGATIEASLAEFGNDITRGMDAAWGIEDRPEEGPGAEAAAPSRGAATPPSGALTAKNPKTGQRIYSTDGGTTWVEY